MYLAFNVPFLVIGSWKFKAGLICIVELMARALMFEENQW